MSIDVNGAKIYYSFFDNFNITQTTVSILIVTLILGISFYFLGKNLKKRPGAIQVLVEKGVGMLYSMVEETMGSHNIVWTPFIGTIFLCSLVGSLISLTGFLRSTTADLVVPLVWAVMVSVIIWYNSIKRNGFLGWLKGFTEPITVMTPMNLISEVAQPLSMAFRHFGNVMGGSVITSVLYTALAAGSSVLLRAICSVGWVIPAVLIVLAVVLFIRAIKKKKKAGKIFGIIFGILGIAGLFQATGILVGIPVLQFGLPALFSLYFDFFSGFIQAFVFSLLTMVYIAASCPPPDDAEN